MPRPYWELSVPVSGDIGEGLTNLAWELGAVGVVEDTALRAFFPPDAVPERLTDRVAEYLAGLRALGYEVDARAPSVAAVVDENWADAWREHFRPVEVGERLLVAPPWDIPATARLVVVIEPGRAFGTGHHGSTAGCLALLERFHAREVTPGRRRPVARALDIGSGSGILAIAAVKLGVGAVLAVDLDPDAVTAATANAARNGVARQVHGMLADAERERLTLPRPWPADGSESPPPGGDPVFSLVLANLLPSAHERLADRYRQLVDDDGVLILGGIPSQDAGGVAGHLRPRGFRLAGREVIDGWTSLALTRS